MLLLQATPVAEHPSVQKLLLKEHGAITQWRNTTRTTSSEVHAIGILEEGRPGINSQIVIAPDPNRPCRACKETRWTGAPFVLEMKTIFCGFSEHRGEMIMLRELNRFGSAAMR
jgi:hypothetical protein